MKSLEKAIADQMEYRAEYQSILDKYPGEDDIYTRKAKRIVAECDVCIAALKARLENEIQRNS